MERKVDEPKGVIAIWTDPEGRVIATESDFELSGYGGFKIWEAQRMRARNSVYREAVRAYCSPAVSKVLSSYLLEGIANEMMKSGHRITLRAIGYDDEVSEAISRS